MSSPTTSTDTSADRYLHRRAVSAGSNSTRTRREPLPDLNVPVKETLAGTNWPSAVAVIT